MTIKVVEPSGPTTFLRPFSIDEDLDYLYIELEYRVSKCYSMLLLYDPRGVLRVQLLSGTFKEEDSLLLHREASYSSCGTLPGPISRGLWRCEILQLPESPPLSLSILLQGGLGRPEKTGNVPSLGTSWIGDDRFSYERYPWDRKVEENRRWYRGDFHTHTTLSDGRLSPKELVELAKERGLDFFVLTEHNLFHTGQPEEDLLVIPGMEVSGRQGHFNLLGCRCFLDWRYDSEDGGCESEEGMRRLLREGRESGALTCINHPFLKPWEWDFKEIDLADVQALELINDPTYPGNSEATEKTLNVLDILWEEGYRIWGIGGSDCHLLPSERNPGAKDPSIIGDPLTYVLAEDLSAQSILEGLQEGRVYVSRGPSLDVRLYAEEETLYPGSQLPSHESHTSQRRILLDIQLRGLFGEESLVVVINGREVIRVRAKAEFKREMEITTLYSWIRVEIRDRENRLLAATNPIFFGEREPRCKTFGEALEKLEKRKKSK